MGELRKTFDQPWRKLCYGGPECNGTKTYSVETTAGNKIISQGCYFEFDENNEAVLTRGDFTQIEESPGHFITKTMMVHNLKCHCKNLVNGNFPSWHLLVVTMKGAGINTKKVNGVRPYFIPKG